MALLPFLSRQDNQRRRPFGRNFALLWTGQTISECGSRITREGLPLTALLLLGATPVQMALLVTASTLPVLVLGLLAGVWVDRLKRRPVMIGADLGRAGLLAAVPLLALSGLLQMGYLYLVAALTGLLTLCFEAANQAFVPLLLEEDQLVEGNSKLSASASLAEIGGPALTGLLVQIMSAPLALIFDALSFVFSAFCVGIMRVDEPAPAKRAERTHLWQEISKGFRLLLREPRLRTTTLILSIRNLQGGTYAALYGLYLLRQLALSPVLYGLLVSTGGIGALLGALLARRLAHRFGLPKTLLSMMLIGNGALLLTPLASGPLWLVMLFLLASQLLGDFALEVYLIHALSQRQALLPLSCLGGATTSVTVLWGTMLLFGTLLASLCSQVIGIRLTFLVTACAGLALQLVCVKLSARKH